DRGAGGADLHGAGVGPLHQVTRADLLLHPLTESGDQLVAASPAHPDAGVVAPQLLVLEEAGLGEHLQGLPGQPAAGGPPQLLAVVDHAVEDPARIPRAVQLVAVQAEDPGLTDQEVLGAAAVIALELLVVLERAAVGTLRLVDVADGQEDVLDRKSTRLNSS